MYIKIIGSLFLMTSAAAIGFLKADELSERVKRLKELKRMMVLLQGELRFHRAGLAEAFEHVSDRVEPPFSGFLKETSEKLDRMDSGGFEQVWREMSKKHLCGEGFCREDLQLLELLRSSLGYLDLTMQTDTLELAILQTEDAIKTAAELKEKRGKLYQTMGITVGALLTLLII